MPLKSPVRKTNWLVRSNLLQARSKASASCLRRSGWIYQNQQELTGAVLHLYRNCSTWHKFQLFKYLPPWWHQNYNPTCSSTLTATNRSRMTDTNTRNLLVEMLNFSTSPLSFLEADRTFSKEPFASSQLIFI